MSSGNQTLEDLFRANAKWAQAVVEADPDFFKKSAGTPQTPQVLWIGCSDSRVPESVVTNSRPGDIFVHRNIANQVHPNDDSVLSVVNYAVEHLKVKHVVVVGHTHCGGAAACVKIASAPPSAQPDIPLIRWLTPLLTLAQSLNVASLEPTEAVSLLVKENVKRQVQNLAEMEATKGVQIHGLVYDLATGTLTNLEVTQQK